MSKDREYVDEDGFVTYEIDDKDTMDKPWDYIDAMTIYKKDLDMSDENISKNYSPYMVNRWLSSIDVLIPIVNAININGAVMSKQAHYNFLKDILPKQKLHIDYKIVKLNKNITDDDVRYIADYYQVGSRDSLLYAEMLTQKEIDSILKTYRYGSNKIAEV